MRRLSLFIVFFLVTLIALDNGLGFVLDRMFRLVRTGDYGGKINNYLALPVTPELVIMGSSRASHQVVPDSFKISAFNLGHDGMYMPFQTGLLRLMEERQKLPRAILLEIDPFEFMEGDLVRDVQNLKYFYNESDTLRKYIDRLSPFEKYKYALNLYRYNGRLVNMAHNYQKSIERTLPYGNGYEALAVTSEDSLKTIYSSQKDVQPPNARFNPRQIRYLESFIEICRRNNIELVCFTAPLYNKLDYFNEGCMRINETLARKRIRYINFVKNRLQELQDHPRLWKDSRHLNDQGARILSGVVAKEGLFDRH